MIDGDFKTMVLLFLCLNIFVDNVLYEFLLVKVTNTERAISKHLTTTKPRKHLHGRCCVPFIYILKTTLKLFSQGFSRQETTMALFLFIF